MDVRLLNGIVQAIGQGITGNQRLGQEERRLQMAERMSALDEQLKRGEIDVQTALNSFHKAQAQFGETVLPYETGADIAAAEARKASEQNKRKTSALEASTGVLEKRNDDEVARLAAQTGANQALAVQTQQAINLGTPGLTAAQQHVAGQALLESTMQRREQAINAEADSAAIAAVLEDPAANPDAYNAAIQAATRQGRPDLALALSKSKEERRMQGVSAQSGQAARLALTMPDNAGPAVQQRVLRQMEKIMGSGKVKPGSGKFFADQYGKRGVEFEDATGTPRMLTNEDLQFHMRGFTDQGQAIMPAKDFALEQGRQERAALLAKTRLEVNAAIIAARENVGDRKAQNTMVGRLRDYFALMRESAAEGFATPAEVAEAQQAYEKALAQTGALPAEAPPPPPTPGRAAALGAGTIFDLNHTLQ